MGKLFAVSLLLLGCEEQLEAYVECNGTQVGYQCKITHQKGGHPARVCWGINGACANGGQVSANGCANVQPKAVVMETIPVAKIRGIDACDQVTSLAVVNVKVVKGI